MESVQLTIELSLYEHKRSKSVYTFAQYTVHFSLHYIVATVQDKNEIVAPKTAFESLFS